MTLAVTESLDLADLEPVRAALAGDSPVLQLQALSTFPGDAGVLFLGVVVTGELLTLRARLHEVLAAQPVTRRLNYLPGRWTPHCTLGQDLAPDELAAAIRLLHGYQPIIARVTSAGILDTVTGTIWPLVG